jgi:hypothetical protein
LDGIHIDQGKREFGLVFSIIFQVAVRNTKLGGYFFNVPDGRILGDVQVNIHGLGLTIFSTHAYDLGKGQQRPCNA